jgi:hypothetical protein
MTPNTRKPDESFEVYKARLKATKQIDKMYNKPKVLWDSSKRGNYFKLRDGTLA